MQAFFDDGDDHAGAHGYPDLVLNGDLAGDHKRLDAQVLLDPFEAQLDLPSLTIQVGDQLGLESEVVRQEREALARMVLDHHTAQRRRLALAGIEHREHAALIANDLRAGAIHRMRITPIELGVALGLGDKRGLSLMNGKQPREIQVATIYQVKRTGLDLQIVQHIDLVDPALGDVNETGNAATQIEPSLQFDGGLGSAKRRLRISRHTQIDGGGVQGVDGRTQNNAQWLAGAMRTCHANQVLCKINVFQPTLRGVSIGQHVALNCQSASAHGKKPLGFASLIDFHVAQRLAARQMRKGRRENLVLVTEILYLELAPVRGHAACEGVQGQVGHRVRKHELALVHGGRSRDNAKDRKSDARRSNRHQTKSPNSASRSFTYYAPM